MGRYALTTLLASVVVALAILTGGAAGASQAVMPAPGDQHNPAIAFNGAGYLVAWTDTRAQSTQSIRTFRPQLPPPPPPPPPPPRADVYGARVSKAGSVLDASGIAIANEAHQRVGPALASDGTNALVVWTDRQGTTAPGVVYGTRITRAGAVLDRAGISIYAGQGEHANPAVAFDGTNYLVVWKTTVWPIGVYLYGARVTPSGTVLDTAPIQIWSTHAASPAIAFDGTNYLVVWQAGFELLATRVSRSGTVLDPGGLVIVRHGTGPPAIAFDVTNYLVAWSDPGATSMYGTRVSPEGQVLDPAGIQLGLAVMYYAKPAMAFGGANYLVAWADTSFGCCSIYGTRVSRDGSILDPFEIAIATRGNEQVEPSVAFDGTNYFVAWADNRSFSSHIYGAHVTQAGRVLEARGILLSTVVQRTAQRVRCVVPRVIGQRLAAARARIRRAHCAVGRIRRTRSGRAGRVVSQSPRPAARRPRGTRVNLVVGRS